MTMKVYEREITKRVPVNRFGRLGYVLVKEIIATDHIDDYNFRKKIKFKEVPASEDIAYLPDQIYERQIKVLSKTW